MQIPIENKEQYKFLILGTVSPPVGGVTKSNENLISSLSSTGNIVDFFSCKIFFRRYDFAHINYSKSWKRLLGLLIGKLVARKVIFTLHSNEFNKNIHNRVNARFYDGVILLNKVAYDKYSLLFKKSTILTSLFKEGIKISMNNEVYLRKKRGKKYILLYAYNGAYRNGREVYGIKFIMANLDKIDEQYIIVLLDPSQSYKMYTEKIDGTRLVYINYAVNFFSLLSEVDIYVRPTSTDGNSVAIQEALLLGKRVIASDVVTRSRGVMTYTYDDFEDFNKKLNNSFDVKQHNYQIDSIKKYLNFIENL